MKPLKRTYSLPPETVERFERAVMPGKRSAFVASLIEERMAEREREALRRDIIRGCQDMAETYLEMEREFHPLEEEVQRAFDP